MSQTPKIIAMQVIPVAGHDSMLLNLSGAHAPFFTRNIVIIKDNAGHTGVGEIPGGEKIRQTLEDAAALVVSLIDQIHGLRRQLRRLGEAVAAEPDEVRARVRARLAPRN